MKEILLEKIENYELKIGIIGLGYVGLPLAVECAKSGFFTLGIDVSTEKVDNINQGMNYIQDVRDEDLIEQVERGLLSATSDFNKVEDLDLIIICVPTPLDKYKQPKLEYIVDSVEKLSGNIAKHTAVVLESTTFPGTTEELILPILEKSGLKSGEDFYLGFSPERVDPGNKDYTVDCIPKVVGGVGADATEILTRAYEKILSAPVHPVSSPKVAEMEKLLENIYRNINIGLANEMALICNKMGINVWEVIEAAKTKPYGFTAFYPGPGIGGHCIPLDPGYLLWKAKEYNYHMKLIQTASEINDFMPEHVVERAIHILNENKKAMSGAKILLCGVAYKENIDDPRESPVLEVIDNLKKYNPVLSYYDPYISEFKVEGEVMSSLSGLNHLKDFDLIIITTAHDNVDYVEIAKSGVPVFDTKNGMKDVVHRENIYLL